MTSQQQLFHTRFWKWKDIVISIRFRKNNIIDQFVPPQEHESQTHTETRRAEMRRLVKNGADRYRLHRKGDLELIITVCLLFMIIFYRLLYLFIIS